MNLNSEKAIALYDQLFPYLVGTALFAAMLAVLVSISRMVSAKRDAYKSMASALNKGKGVTFNIASLNQPQPNGTSNWRLITPAGQIEKD